MPQICPHCQAKIAAPDARFCDVCGIALPTNTVKRFCGICGAEFPVDSAAYADSPNPVALADSLNTIVLTQSVITLGRHQGNDICLNHPAIAEFHARLEQRAAQWYVVDERSAKGTFVNFTQVPHDTTGLPIAPVTDILWVAPYLFRLSITEQPSPSFEQAHLQLDVRDLVRTVAAKDHPPKTILNLIGVPLSFRPGDFIALVGGSGAGKSTLMKVLMGLAVAEKGTVYVSGRPYIHDGQTQRFAALHAITGYVPQDNVLHTELTPQEALDYAARIRLSPDLSEAERAGYIEETLNILELGPHQHTCIRDLSGGQQKRVNIALELLAKPRLLFLDEPTSGLDPGLDLRIMEILRAWAANTTDKRTIVLVTHATENIGSCSYVTFMAPGGYVAYFGPPGEAKKYFKVDRFAKIYRKPEMTMLEKAPQAAEAFRASADYKYVRQRALAHPQTAEARDTQAKPQARFHGQGPTSADYQRFWQQLHIMIDRYWKLIGRDRMSYFMHLAQGVLVALLLISVAQPGTFQPMDAQNAKTVLFIMACAAAWLGILNSTKELVKEQAIYSRERRYGLLAPPYVLSKQVVLGILGAFQMGILLVILSLRIELPQHGALGSFAPVWLEWFVTLELTLLAGLSLGLLISALSATVEAATAIMFGLLLIQVMFAGVFFSDAPWADFLSVFTFSRWGLEAAGISADLNGLLAKVIPNYRVNEAYHYSALALIGRWSILMLYSIFLTVAASLLQARKH